MIASLFNLAKPVLVLVALIAAYFPIQHYCSQRVFCRADGLPLDHAGNLLKCQSCGGVAWFKGGYQYQCEQCGSRYEAHYDSVQGVLMSAALR